MRTERFTPRFLLEQDSDFTVWSTDRTVRLCKTLQRPIYSAGVTAHLAPGDLGQQQGPQGADDSERLARSQNEVLQMARVLPQRELNRQRPLPEPAQGGAKGQCQKHSVKGDAQTPRPPHEGSPIHSLSLSTGLPCRMLCPLPIVA